MVKYQASGLEKKRLRQLRKAIKRGRFVQIEKKLRTFETYAAREASPMPCRASSIVAFDAIDTVDRLRPEYVRRCRVDLGNRQIRIERAEREARRRADRAEERKAERIAEREARKAAAKKAAALEKRRATLAAKKAAGGTADREAKPARRGTGRGA